MATDGLLTRDAVDLLQCAVQDHDLAVLDKQQADAAALEDALLARLQLRDLLRTVAPQPAFASARRRIGCRLSSSSASSPRTACSSSS